MTARWPAGWRAAALIAALVVLSPNALPVPVPAAFQRAERAAAAGEWAAAADALDEAAARLPYDGYSAYRAGLANLAAGRYADAAQHLQTAAALSGWDAARRTALGPPWINGSRRSD